MTSGRCGNFPARHLPVCGGAAGSWTVTQSPDGSSGEPSLSADGRYVAFDSGAPDLLSGDTNNATDVFVHDLDASDTAP